MRSAREIEDAVFFYVDTFTKSPAASELNARFGSPINFTTDEGFAIARFLRALNVAFNLDLAKQRVRAALTVFNRFRDQNVDIQIKLLRLADAEIDDALAVLQSNRVTQPFYPLAVDRLGLAKTEIAAAIAAPASSRGGSLSNAVSGSKAPGTRSARTSASRSVRGTSCSEMARHGARPTIGTFRDRIARFRAF